MSSTPSSGTVGGFPNRELPELNTLFQPHFVGSRRGTTAGITWLQPITCSEALIPLNYAFP
jgi:hypothetical protein